MAKNKKKKPGGYQAGIFSPESYLKRGNARKLPIYECLVPDGWEEIKKFSVIIARRHTNGHITFANLLVDLMCTGIKDAMYAVNIPEFEYREMVDRYPEIDLYMQPVQYNLVHNIVYEALAYAEDYGITPHRNFALAEMILEEDDESIPLMEIPLGENGKPLLVLHPDEPRNDYYLRQVHKNAGPGNYNVINGDVLPGDFAEDPFDEDYSLEEWTEEDWADFLENTKPGDLDMLDPAIDMIYEKCVFDPHMAGKQLAATGRTVLENITVTFDAIGTENYTDEELRLQSRIYTELNDPDISRSHLRKIIAELQQLIQKWHDNTVLHNYLYTAYMQNHEILKADEIIELIMKKFPEYLFGKIAYANRLIEKGQAGKVPDVFGGEYSLKGLYPDRNEFHIAELTSFHSLMGMYFLENGDTPSAYLYYKMLRDLDLPEGYPLPEKLIVELTLSIFKEVKGIIGHIQAGKLEVKEVIALLMAD